MPQVFEDDAERRPAWAERARAALDELLTVEEIDAARRSTINAHYTSPEIASQVWRVLEGLGWEGRSVWEPGCGIGVFAATAPAGVVINGIELDPTTASIAKRLHGDVGHEIEAGSLVDVEVNGAFDAAVGNVPFAEVRPFHPVANPDRELTLHNLAIRQSLRSVRPGGLVAVVTSSFTLDSEQPVQRERLAREGRFIGAVRLPASAFDKHSGTQVTTDLVIFQRLQPGETQDMTGWGSVVEVGEADGQPLRANEWYADNPDLVLGEITSGGMYGRGSTRVVLEFEQLPDRLEAAIDRLAELGPERLQDLPPVSERQAVATGVRDGPPRPTRPTWIKPGGIYRQEGGFWTRPADGRPDEPYTVKPARDQRLLGHLVDLRDTYARLVDAEATSASDEELASLRSDLNRFYDAAVSIGGPLNQVNISVRADGAEVRRRPAFGGMRKSDPDFATLQGLETYDIETGVATKAPIFSTRQIRPVIRSESAGSPSEAIAIVLHEYGHLDRGRLGELLNVEDVHVDDVLGSLAFTDPGTGALVPRSVYLSGDVRGKLDEAAIAASSDAGFERNVDALNAVKPTDLEWEEIQVNLGASWVTPAELKLFIDETFDAPTDDVRVGFDPVAGWSLNAGAARRSRAETYTSTWGTDRAHALDLLDAGLRNRPVKVYDTLPENKRVLNREETVLANQKLDELNLAFNEWLGQDPVRADSLASRYNRLFRSHVAPSFDGDEFIRPQGLADGLELRSHQAAAVQRMLQTNNVGLYHVVGAGKTWTMATSVMEQRRLGQASKPMMVVPNHLLRQVAGEFQQAYPAAKILTPEGRSPADRRRFISQAAAGDWDCVIVPQSVFGSIPVTTATEAAYIEDRVGDMRASIVALKEQGTDSDSATVKRIEKRVSSMEERLKELLDRPRDPSICFEYIGIDAIYADEAHEYKNLEVVTGRQDLAVTASKRAADMDMKLRWLAEQPHRASVMLATGTPLTNSFHELWVMMRLASPELLEHVGVERFDSFCAQFGKLVVDYELSPSGWRLKDRFAAFQNIPELQNLFAQHADVQLAEDLDLPRPALEGGQPQQVLVPANVHLRAFIGLLEQRSENLPQDPRIDNRLAILNDYRFGAIDLRLVDRVQPNPSKISAVAEAIAQRFHEERDRTYVDRRSGEPSPEKGSLQVAFLDAGVPGGSRIDLYSELRSELATHGLPPERVAFIHDAKDTKALFAACREGRVSVLVGSTQKMGTGMNVQDRLTALWHIDVPYRPADIEQRNGRGLRQGNQNPEIGIFHVIQEGSGDALSYQIVERKAKMIASVLKNTNAERTISALDEPEITFGDLKALATGDQEVVEHLRAKRELGELEIAHRAWERRSSRARSKVDRFTAAVERTEAEIATLERVVDLVDRGAIATPSAPRTPDAESDNARLLNALPKVGSERSATIATIGDIPVEVTKTNPLDGFGSRYDVHIGPVSVTSFETRDLERGINLTSRLNRFMNESVQHLQQANRQLERDQGDLNQAKLDLGSTFGKTDELQAARVTVATLEDKLAKKAKAADEVAAEPTSPDPPAVATKRGPAPYQRPSGLKP